jgi:cysteine-rich repeat protein
LEVHLARMLVLLPLTLAFSACVASAAQTCGDLLCPAGNVCVADGCASVEEAAACASDEASCTTSTITLGVCIGGACRAVICGDGKITGSEICDDGNLVDGDGCARCASNETCGNAYVDLSRGEQCDSGVVGLSNDGCSSQCSNEVPQWKDIVPARITARVMHRMAYDGNRQRILLFGGDTPPSLFTGTIGQVPDVFDFDGVVWREISSSIVGNAPPQKQGAAMAFDQTAKKMLWMGANGAVAETWQFAGKWQRLPTQSDGPSGRGQHRMVYDTERRQVVMFGGIDATTGKNINDLWAFDGSRWNQLAANSGAPAMAAPFAMAYDSARRRLIVAGNVIAQNTATLGLWEFDSTNATWIDQTNRIDALLPASFDLQVAYDSVRNVAVLLTVTDSSYETRTFDGSRWKVQAVASPPPRYAAELEFDPVRKKLVLFGGIYLAQALGDTWEFDGTWREVPAATTAAVPNSYDHAMAYDWVHGNAVTFGGLERQCSADTKLFDGLSWRLMKPRISPEGRYGHKMVYDSKRDRFVMFGGEVCGVAPSQQTWIYSAGNWTEVDPVNSPPARSNFAMAYDTARDRVIVHGGQRGFGEVFDDTWEFDGITWMQVTGSGALPSGVGNTMDCIDAEQGCILYNGDVWRYRNQQWAKITTVGQRPLPRQYPVFGCDPTNRWCILFGGDANGNLGNDTWLFANDAWTDLSAKLQLEPLPGYHAAGAFDRTRGRLLLTGGSTIANVATMDTWSFQFSDAFKPADICAAAALDSDGDGLFGCDDPDCWGACRPACPPTQTTVCDDSSPHCGDGDCTAGRESILLCPQDCQ